VAKITIYETFTKADIDALLTVGAHLALAFDASHPHAVKTVHLELGMQISATQIVDLESRFHTTYIKLKGGLMHGEGKYKLEAHHFEQDIVDASPKVYEIRKNRAIVKHGDVGGMVADIGWW